MPFPLISPVPQLAPRATPDGAPTLPPSVIEDLAAVETRLAAEIGSREPRLEAIARHLVDAGGKRVRPALVLLVFHAASRQRAARRQHAIEAAVALELIHSATLLHDDIIDGCETRRGRPSALRTFGTADTLVAGDFLFSRAFALCAQFEPEVIRWAADACIALTEGEVLQGRFRHNPQVTLDDYLEIIRRKTASLFEAGARTAAHLAGAAPDMVESMARCGHEVGLAFQMSDDLLDVAGRPDVTGKPRGVDLRDGNPSLPIVLALERVPALRDFFAGHEPSAAAIAGALEQITRCGVLGDVVDHARSHVAAAVSTVVSLPPSAARDALEALIEDLAARIR